MSDRGSEKGTVRRGGRPRKNLDPRLIRQFAEVGASTNEMAAVIANTDGSKVWCVFQKAIARKMFAEAPPASHIGDVDDVVASILGNAVSAETVEWFKAEVTEALNAPLGFVLDIAAAKPNKVRGRRTKPSYDSVAEFCAIALARRLKFVIDDKRTNRGDAARKAATVASRLLGRYKINLSAETILRRMENPGRVLAAGR
jgi:hypothetical protein